ncbi:MAG: replication initiation factor domain-containing protein [Clostridiales bacterium]|nr:replication initiation factor domain-containing protein [Clostridiales bacterium]
MNTNLTCVIDWLQFTIHGLTYDEVILQVLKHSLAEYILLPKGRYGYKTQYINGNISVLCDGTEDMGVHVILTGKGCREYESTGELLELMDRVMFYNGVCTRIDLAVDDKTGQIIKFKEMIKFANKGHVISKWKTTTEIIKRELKDGKIIGHTLSIGSRSSKIYLRIYDKAMEQGISSPWYRMELEIKDDRAEVLQNILLFETGVGRVFSGILNQYIRFVIPSSDKNKSRWETAKWWTELVDSVDKVKLTRKPKEKTIEEVRQWVKKQIGPTLAMLMIHDEGDMTNLLKIIHSGKYRLKQRHFQILKNAQKESKTENL